MNAIKKKKCSQKDIKITSGSQLSTTIEPDTSQKSSGFHYPVVRSRLDPYSLKYSSLNRNSQMNMESQKQNVTSVPCIKLKRRQNRYQEAYNPYKSVQNGMIQNSKKRNIDDFVQTNFGVSKITNIRVESLAQQKSANHTNTPSMMSNYRFALKNPTVEQMNTLKENVYNDTANKDRSSDSSRSKTSKPNDLVNTNQRYSEKLRMRRLSIKKKPRDLSLLLSFKSLFETSKANKFKQHFKQTTNSTSSRTLNSSERKSMKSIVRKMLIEMANNNTNEALPRNYKALKDLIKKHRKIPFIGIKETPYYKYLDAKNPNKNKDLLKNFRK